VELASSSDEAAVESGALLAEVRDVIARVEGEGR
jgi:hypothetical protein